MTIVSWELISDSKDMNGLYDVYGSLHLSNCFISYQLTHNKLIPVHLPYTKKGPKEVIIHMLKNIPVYNYLRTNYIQVYLILIL